jgi:hypothetical protein
LPVTLASFVTDLGKNRNGADESRKAELFLDARTTTWPSGALRKGVNNLRSEPVAEGAEVRVTGMYVPFSGCTDDAIYMERGEKAPATPRFNDFWVLYEHRSYN